MTDVEVVLVNVDERTAFCSDGVTREIFEFYGSDAQPTEDPDEAIACVVKVGDTYIVCNLMDDKPIPIN